MTDAVRAKIGASMRGDAHPNYKGGTWLARPGERGVVRAFVAISEDLRVRLGLSRPYTLRARVVWLDAHPGETLKRTDVIHHVNGDALDDRPENLQRFTSQRSHAALHDKVGEINSIRTRLPDKPCEICSAPIRPWRKFCSRACTAVGKTGALNVNFGKTPPREQIERANLKRIGRKASDETRAKMSASHRARFAD